MKRSNSGFTFVEIMIATLVFSLVVGILLLVFIGGLSLNNLSANLTTAINGAQVKLEEMYRRSFDILRANYASGGTPGNNFSVTNWVLPHSGIVAIIDDGSDEPDHLTDNDLIQITITVCWQESGGRVIGEDKDLNGVFNVATEDDNGNGRLDSPAQLITLMSRH